MKIVALAMLMAATYAYAPEAPDICNIKVVSIGGKWYYAVQRGTGPIKFLHVK